jgi:hypothetical protein
MGDSPTQLYERLENLLSDWKSVSAIGVALLYVVGYLSLRAHITALGIYTEQALLDERYLFAGARAIIYLVSCVCIVLFLALLVGLPVYLLWQKWSRVKSKKAEISGSRATWSSRTVALVGIIASVLMIQFVLVQAFTIHDVLLKDPSPDSGWLPGLLRNEIFLKLQSLYFGTMLLAVGFSVFCWIRGQQMPVEDALTRSLYYVLLFLLFVQALLVPYNHGVIVAEKTIPRIDVPQGIDDPGKTKMAWLVWEGKNSITFLVWDLAPDSQPKRSLVTLLRKDVKKVEIKDLDHCYLDLCAEDGQKKTIKKFLEQRSGAANHSAEKPKNSTM